MTIGDWLKSQIQSLLFPTSSIGAIDWGGGRSEEAKQSGKQKTLLQSRRVGIPFTE
jgi:hypothetical protein